MSCLKKKGNYRKSTKSFLCKIIFKWCLLSFELQEKQAQQTCINQYYTLLKHGQLGMNNEHDNDHLSDIISLHYLMISFIDLISCSGLSTILFWMASILLWRIFIMRKAWISNTYLNQRISELEEKKFNTLSAFFLASVILASFSGVSSVIFS